MITVTRSTTVKDAVMSCRAGRDLFIEHGIDPLARCTGMYDLNTLDDAEDWCHLTDVDGLIRELNRAIAAETGAPAEKGTPAAAGQAAR